MSTIGHYAIRKLVTASTGTSVCDVAATMNGHNIGAVIVTRDGEIIGMITERCICRQIVGMKMSADTVIDDLVEQVPRMSPATSVQDAVETMRRSGSRYIFVTNPDGRTDGVVSMQDLIRALSELCQAEAEALRKYVSGET
ncbi:MAG: CBS domain-containing protein [Candidatus Hydrogenedentota bacterium]